MKRPIESDYKSQVAYTRALEAYCDALAQPEQYQQSNPLGGPAKVFDAMADAIRAGDSYESVLKQFSYQLAQPKPAIIGTYLEKDKEQEPVASYCRECLTYNGHQEGCSHYINNPIRNQLTNEQILEANYPDGEENGPTIAAPDFELVCFARAIEAAHGIKE